MKKYVRSLVLPWKKMLVTSPPKLRAFAVVLVIMVLSELYLNNDAVAQLVDVDATEFNLDLLRSVIVALFLTVILVAFNFFGGDRAKRFYCQWCGMRDGAYSGIPDKSMLVIAILAPVVSFALTFVISYIRYSVGLDASGSADVVSASAAQSGVNLAATGANFSFPEVLLLAAVLIAAIIFSFVYAFVTTDFSDLAKARSVKQLEEDICQAFARSDAEHVDEFVAESIHLIEHIGKSTTARAKDKVLVSLLELCNDPAIATSVYRSLLAYGNQHSKVVKD